MQQRKACGVICFRERPHRQFLLMQHPTRWDLPKGHIEDGESEIDCALREMHEETGFAPEQVRLDPDFRWETSYDAHYQDGTVHKTVAIFLAWVDPDAEITLTEHTGYRWFAWSPPHSIQPETIDPLLAAVAAWFDEDRQP